MVLQMRLNFNTVFDLSQHPPSCSEMSCYFLFFSTILISFYLRLWQSSNQRPQLIPSTFLHLIPTYFSVPLPLDVMKSFFYYCLPQSLLRNYSPCLAATKLLELSIHELVYMAWHTNSSIFLSGIWYDLIFSYDLHTSTPSYTIITSCFDKMFSTSSALNLSLLGIKWCSTTRINHRGQSTRSPKVLFYSLCFLPSLISFPLLPPSFLLSFPPSFDFLLYFLPWLPSSPPCCLLHLISSISLSYHFETYFLASRYTFNFFIIDSHLFIFSFKDVLYSLY